MRVMRGGRGRVVWSHGSEGSHEMRVLSGGRGRVVWLYGSEGIT